MRVNQESCELLNGVEVTQLDMLKLVEAMEARSSSLPDEDFYAGVHKEVERLFGRTEKANAVEVRFEALARMIEEEVVKSWARPGRRPGARPAVDLELLDMVAKAKLVECGGLIGFNQKPFARYAGIKKRGDEHGKNT